MKKTINIEVNDAIMDIFAELDRAKSAGCELYFSHDNILNSRRGKDEPKIRTKVFDIAFSLENSQHTNRLAETTNFKIVFEGNNPKIPRVVRFSRDIKLYYKHIKIENLPKQVLEELFDEDCQIIREVLSQNNLDSFKYVAYVQKETFNLILNICEDDRGLIINPMYVTDVAQDLAMGYYKSYYDYEDEPENEDDIMYEHRFWYPNRHEIADKNRKK